MYFSEKILEGAYVPTDCASVIQDFYGIAEIIIFPVF